MFLLCGETLAHKILENPNINGIKLGQLEQIIAQFADDTQLFLKTRQSVEEAIKTLAKIEGNIGLTVNYEKSCIYAINAPVFQCTKPLIWDPGGLNVLGVDALASADTHYNKTIEKCSCILKEWSKRQLTLLGKILIVNTLIISMFIYLFQVLEDPSTRVIDAYNTMISNFIWNNKKPKIKTDALYANYQDGGLQLSKIKNKNVALKIGILFKTDEYTENMLRNIVPEELGNLFWECALTRKELGKICAKNDNIFWLQAVIHWFELTWSVIHSSVLNKAQINKQMLWLNERIRIKGDVVMYKDAALVGINHVGDIVNLETGKLLSYEQIREKYQIKLGWLRYKSLCAAIPKTWTKILKNREADEGDCEDVYILREKIMKAPKKANVVYKMLRDKEDSQIHHYYQLFNKKVPCEMEEYVENFTQLRLLTKTIKFRDFQYRLLMNAIHANDRLYHWKIVPTKKCEYCEETQTVTHMIWSCKKFTEYMDETKKIRKGLHYIIQCQFRVKPMNYSQDISMPKSSSP